MSSTLWERLDPGFLAPVWLGLGVLAVIAVLLLEMGARRHRRQALRHLAGSHLAQVLMASLSPGKRLLKRVLLLAAIALIFIALARPHLFYKWQEEDRTGLDILMAVDCSRSMLSQDVKPNRLERAKLAIADFSQRVPNNRLGLIAFAGDAFLQCPLTLDHDAFNETVRDLDTTIIPRPGTDIATALEEAEEALKSQAGNAKFLILITDGEDLEGRVIDAARQAAKNGIKIYTVGIGTPAGDLIPMEDENNNVAYLRDSAGQVVQSKLDEKTLQQIASITGGAYLSLGQDGEGLETLYNRYIATLPQKHLESRRDRVRFEQFEWPLGLALLFLIGEFLLTERVAARPKAPLVTAPAFVRRRRTSPPATALTTLLLLLALPAVLPAANSDAVANPPTPEQAHQQELLQKAREQAEQNPDRKELQYNRGYSAYRAGDYTEAEEAFGNALDTRNLPLQEKAYYNLGDAEFRHGESMIKADKQRAIDLWQQALNSYDSALKLKNSPLTQHNYDVVKKRLDQLKQEKKQEDQQKQEQQKQQKPQDQKNNPSQSPKDQSGQDQDKNQGQNQSSSGQNGQDSSHPADGSPGQPGQDSSPQKGSGQDSASAGAGGEQQQAKGPVNARSEARAEDKQDPGARSRQDAENLLDSLKNDEHRLTARDLQRNGDVPSTPSGKDW